MPTEALTYQSVRLPLSSSYLKLKRCNWALVLKNQLPTLYVTDIRRYRRFDARLPTEVARSVIIRIVPRQPFQPTGIHQGVHFQYAPVDVTLKDHLPGFLGHLDIPAVDTTYGHRVDASTHLLDKTQHPALCMGKERGGHGQYQ